MEPADLIKQAREKKGWTQKELADAIGVTSGFITKVETDQALPSYERCMAIASVLEVPLDTLWVEVERARVESFQQRIRTRGAAVRGTFRTRGASLEPPAALPIHEMTAEEIAREITADADLQTAYRNLKLALADPKMRPTVLAALEAFAHATRLEPTE